MSSSRKLLKFVSTINLVFSIIAIIMGVTAFVSCVKTPESVLAATSATALKSIAMVEVSTIALTVFSIWGVFVAAMGIRGANNPTKMGFVTVIACITAILSVGDLIAAIATGSFTISIAIDVLVDLIMLYACFEVRKEGKGA
ncbi:hypothetical protein [Paratractidigestivibacter sp.]|uniref:hypothetical protein n=1 Tax=Paratractidigestivibacter sp. TaxID=2847316 RepID=UPI002ABD3579|nr:hypothetical protein [Paratractidigestivibacter sp.]